MRVFVEPTGLHSRAMIRVANALARHSPADIRFTSRIADADIVILHVIGSDAIDYSRSLLRMGKKYAVIQYCIDTAGGDPDDWADMWENALVVWTYYPQLAAPLNVMLAPLGIDAPFRQSCPSPARDRLVVTSGYVHGPGAEAIEDVWRAADETGFAVAHLGPREVVGTTYRPKQFELLNGISDPGLARIYHRAQWVSGLRYVEGFELPAVEGLACGARPILFNHLHYWYGNWGMYVRENHLFDDLCSVMVGPWHPIDEGEWKRILTTFDWRPICTNFWSSVAHRLDSPVAVVL